MATKGRDTQEKDENGAIRKLLSRLKSTIPGETLSKAENEYKILKDCRLELETRYKDKHKWHKNLREEKGFDTLEPTEKDQARGILNVIKNADNFESDDTILDLTKKAKQELVSLIDAHFLLKMCKGQDDQTTQSKNIKTEEHKEVQKGSRSKGRFDGIEDPKEKKMDLDPADVLIDNINRLDADEDVRNLYFRKKEFIMERTMSLPEPSRQLGGSSCCKPHPSASGPTYSSRGFNEPPSQYDVRDDDFPQMDNRLSRSLSSNSGNDCYEIPQPSWSPTTSTSSKPNLKRSVSVNSAENQDSSPIMDLALSYRKRGDISEDFLQEIEREYNKLDRTKKNFSMKFSRVSSMRLSTTLETKDLDDLPDDPKSSYYSIKRFLRSTRRDSLYQDAVNECAELVETEQRYCLAKSTNVNVFSSVSDVHGNVVLTRKQFEEMQNEITRKTQEADELTTRLSRMASQQMTEGNPNIADLSDRYRPTKIGEMFGQLYDDEWSEAYEALKEKSTVDEDEDEFQKDVLKKLVHVVKAAFDFSMEESEKQYCCLKDSILKSGNLQSSTSNVDREMETFCTRTAKEVRKKLASHCWRKAAEMYKERKTHSFLSKYSTDKRLIEYIDKCMELSWYMSVQDPPMSLVLAHKGDKMDTAEYCYHGKKGKIVDMCVWPSLHLHEGGPLVSKGYVLPQ